MRSSSLALIVLAASSLGCNKIWGRSIANTAEDDLRGMVAALGVKARVACQTPSAIRRSRCTVRLTADEHDALVKRLGLSATPPEKSHEDPKVTCDAWREGRAVERHLRMEPLPDVGAQLGQPYRGFDLYWDPKTGESCIELRIAYG